MISNVSEYIDYETGVHYLLNKDGGICVRVDKDGKPYIPKNYYIAYGSDVNYSNMKNCCQNFKYIGTSILEGYKLVFKECAYGSLASLEQQEGACTPCVVYEVSDKDIKCLDYAQNYPVTYSKKVQDIKCYRRLEDNRTEMISVTDAFFYILYDSRLGTPTKEYVMKMIEGYKDYDLDLSVLKMSLKSAGFQLSECGL